MKYCRYCGKQIDDDSVFCTYCGRSQTIHSKKNVNKCFVDYIKSKILPFVFKIKDRIKLPHSKFASSLPQKLFMWAKRLGRFVIAIGLVYILIASATFGYYYLQENQWNAKDYAFINNLNKTDKVSLDSVFAFIESEESHYARDWFDIKHCCSFDHKNEIEKILNHLAEKGDLNAQLLLGRYYKSGSYYPFKKVNFIDKEKSSFWFYLAAKQGNPEAQGELGHNYKYGSGVKQDFAKAFYWTKKGAINGDAVSQWRLGNIYAYGLGYYTKYFSDTDCHTWWYSGSRFLSAGDCEESISNNESIKDMLQSGPNIVIVPKDIKKALYYWKLASDQGLEEAKENLHKVYDIEDIDTLEN